MATFYSSIWSHWLRHFSNYGVGGLIERVAFNSKTELNCEFEFGKGTLDISAENSTSSNGRHCSAVSSAATILWVRIPSTPSTLSSIYIVEIETVFVIAMIQGRK